MDETQWDDSPANNAVFGFFSFLGACCAVMVGIAIFDPGSLKREVARSPASTDPSPTEFRLDQPILD